MYTINPKYKNVEKLIHNFNGTVKHLRDYDLIISIPKSPRNPVAGSKIYQAASQEDLEKIFLSGNQDIVIKTKKCQKEKRGLFLSSGRK